MPTVFAPAAPRQSVAFWADHIGNHRIQDRVVSDTRRDKILREAVAHILVERKRIGWKLLAQKRLKRAGLTPPEVAMDIADLEALRDQALGPVRRPGPVPGAVPGIRLGNGNDDEGEESEDESEESDDESEESDDEYVPPGTRDLPDVDYVENEDAEAIRQHRIRLGILNKRTLVKDAKALLKSMSRMRKTIQERVLGQGVPLSPNQQDAFSNLKDGRRRLARALKQYIERFDAVYEDGATPPAVQRRLRTHWTAVVATRLRIGWVRKVRGPADVTTPLRLAIQEARRVYEDSTRSIFGSITMRTDGDLEVYTPAKMKKRAPGTVVAATPSVNLPAPAVPLTAADRARLDRDPFGGAREITHDDNEYALAAHVRRTQRP